MDIINQHSLTANGFNSKQERFNIDPERLHLIRGFIWKNFKPTIRKTQNSYKLKHFVEGALGSMVNSYVSNGELIVAMIAEGYKPVNISGLNCCFKVDIESEYNNGFRFGKKIWKHNSEKYDEMMDRHELFLEESVGEGGYDPKMNLSDLGYKHAMIRWHVRNGMDTKHIGDYQRDVFYNNIFY